MRENHLQSVNPVLLQCFSYRLSRLSRITLIFVSTSDILYCEAESNYTTVVLPNRKIVVSKTLKEIDEALSGVDFYRIHNSFLINLNHIQKFVRGDGGYVLMNDGKAVSISRSRRQEFMELFSRF